MPQNAQISDQDQPPTSENVRIVGDSECTVAALRKQGSALQPYFQNRIAEAHEIMQEIMDVTGRGQAYTQDSEPC